MRGVELAGLLAAAAPIVLAGALLLWLSYRLRAAEREARACRARAIRIAERERLARGLHDGLLQSVQGLVLHFQSAADCLSPAEPARRRLEAGLACADAILIDARTQARDLKLREMPDRLPALIGEQARLAGLGAAAVRLRVTGAERTLTPLVAVELSRIAAEALTNIARHAGASAVEIAIAFTPRLTLTIADNGRGPPTPVGACDGRCGILDMRDRAARIGAAFALEHAPGGGTLVRVTVPPALAFADARSDGRAETIDRLWRAAHGRHHP